MTTDTKLKLENLVIDDSQIDHSSEELVILCDYNIHDKHLTPNWKCQVELRFPFETLRDYVGDNLIHYRYEGGFDYFAMFSDFFEDGVMVKRFLSEVLTHEKFLSMYKESLKAKPVSELIEIILS